MHGSIINRDGKRDAATYSLSEGKQERTKTQHTQTPKKGFCRNMEVLRIKMGINRMAKLERDGLEEAGTLVKAVLTSQPRSVAA